MRAAVIHSYTGRLATHLSVYHYFFIQLIVVLFSYSHVVKIIVKTNPIHINKLKMIFYFILRKLSFYRNTP